MDRICPRCGGELERVRRRFVDRVISVLWAVRRYRCRNVLCVWEGNLHQKRGEQKHGAEQVRTRR